MNRIKFLREERGWTQAFLAEKMQFSRQVLSNYENEINQPAPDVLIKFADIFECSIDYLLCREDDFGVISIATDGARFPDDAQELVDMFLKLSPDLQHRALTYVNNLLKVNEEEKRLKINKK